MGVIVVPGVVAPLPYAPTLLSPPNGAFEDLSQEPVFTWQYNPAQTGLTQTAYQFAILVNGGSTPLYWNYGAHTFQTTPYWISGAFQSLIFPMGAFTDGNVYQWTVATQDANGRGPAANLWTINAQAPPVVTVLTPSGTITTSTPIVSWGMSFPTGVTQTGFRVIIYNETQYTAAGFTPGSGPAVYDTGLVGSTYTTSVDLSTIPVNLQNTVSYRAYVQVTESGGQASAWAYSSFTVTYFAPNVPVITAAQGTDPGTGMPVIDLLVVGQDNLLSAQDANPTLGLGSWRPLANCTVASTGSGLQMTRS